MKLLLGIDIGTSSIKVSVIDAQNQQFVATAQYPDEESEITVLQAGWAEQSPEMWWTNVQQAILRCTARNEFNPKDIAAIGIAYQMHGLVLVDEDQEVIRESIIWCDSRAVELGHQAFTALGEEFCLSHLLNSPGNFTASKLAWVKQNEAENYKRIHKVMLPGDFIAMKLTKEITTSISALSEGIFWDFKKQQVSEELLAWYDLDRSHIPEIKAVFAEHGRLEARVAASLGLRTGIPVTYKAGDQPNNALSLNVMEPGEVAATAGTSGVIYGISDQLAYDPQSRVNTFAHVNHSSENQRLGILLCINGTGSMNRWAKQICGTGLTYQQMNAAAAATAAGAAGLKVIPFGNGAERMLSNTFSGAELRGIDLNVHTAGHIFRAVQEGIAYSFRYGLDIMRSNGLNPKVIRAGKANLFLSDVFLKAFVNATQVPVELYDHDGSKGAALGAGIGAGVYTQQKEAFQHNQALSYTSPDQQDLYETGYQDWLSLIPKN